MATYPSQTASTRPVPVIPHNRGAAARLADTLRDAGPTAQGCPPAPPKAPGATRRASRAPPPQGPLSRPPRRRRHATPRAAFSSCSRAASTYRSGRKLTMRAVTTAAASMMEAAQAEAML